MRSRLAGFAVISLFVLMMVPAYASVTSLSLEKSFYTTDEKFGFIGTLNETDSVFVIIRNAGGAFKGMLSDPLSTDEFNVIPRPVSDFFKFKGIYDATAFTGQEKEEDGFTIKLEFDGEKLFEVQDFVLQLKTIIDKTIEVEKTISFTASLTDSSIDDVVFSLNSAAINEGATIDPSSGKFVWTPLKSHGSFQDVPYSFDIVVKSRAQEDRENITITVKKAYDEPETTEPEPETTTETTEPELKELEIPAPFVDETKEPQSYVDRYNTEASYKKWFDDNYSEYSSIYEAVGLEKQLEIPALFVDESKDPQSYVDRYNSEASYKKWFDDNYSEYFSIYEAVGLDEPKELAPFVDPNLDPQYYIDRYNNEITYKDWFDKTYPDITIYKAVGLDEPVIEEPEFGECGKGTKLIDGKCTIVATKSEGGGCLIATAAYGSEMAPQVQLLREIRDNQLMKTDSGVSFMTGFNQFYYSFSPYIADMQRENPVFQEVVKIGITPLLSSLSIMSYAESESQVIGYGIGVILMNIGMYFAAPVMLFYGIRKVRRVRF
ncbi:MAG: CFI-box-CTERM domain-containing protein [Nitrosopumilus sp.]